MRKLIPLATVIAIAGALAAGVAASTAATGATRITCNTTEYNHTPTKASGVVVGLTSCSKPFGNGAVSATYTSTFDPTTGAGTDTGPFTKWLGCGYSRTSEECLLIGTFLRWRDGSGVRETRGYLDNPGFRAPLAG